MTCGLTRTPTEGLPRRLTGYQSLTAEAEHFDTDICGAGKYLGVIIVLINIQRIGACYQVPVQPAEQSGSYW